MATIQLGQEVLAVEALIDERNHDDAFRQLVLSRERFGRRPEYKYLQALFDATFQSRADKELVRDVTSLVAEQPDFLEAVALLAFLYNRSGDTGKATVFAREALRSTNPRTVHRARQVLRESRPASQGFEAPPGSAAAHPQTSPQPHLGDTLAGSGPPKATGGVALDRTLAAPGFVPPGVSPTFAAVAARKATLEFAEVQPQPVTNPPALQPLAETSRTPPGPFVPPALGGMSRGAEPSIETITFAPSDAAMPPPPTIPPAALTNPSEAQLSQLQRPASRQAPSSPGFGLTQPKRSLSDSANRTVGSASSRARPTPAPVTVAGTQSRPIPRGERIESLSPDLAVDHTGVDYRASIVRPSRAAIAIPPPAAVQRQWFKYARANQVTAAPISDDEKQGSTALTLLDLAERVVEGQTPLSPEPIPLDRRGLILVEQKLDSVRSTRGGAAPGEKAATTASAAFLLAVLMKESEARAVDTTPEDGGCKAVLPGGVSVRPLLIAAAYARGKGPGLVESFDRAATAHMQRTPRSPPSAAFRFGGAQTEKFLERSAPPKPALSVSRHDVDAGTLALVDSDCALSRPPQQKLRVIAEEFWSTTLGREIMGSSQHAATFSLGDIDALERYATKAFPLVGTSPPGDPWPWAASESIEKQIFAWGAILGEVLLAVYTGRWEVDPEQPDDRHLYRVVLAESVIAWPVAQVFLRVSRGVAHDLSAYVDVVGRIVGRQASRALGA